MSKNKWFDLLVEIKHDTNIRDWSVRVKKKKDR